MKNEFVIDESDLVSKFSYYFTTVVTFALWLFIIDFWQTVFTYILELYSLDIDYTHSGWFELSERSIPPRHLLFSIWILPSTLLAWSLYNKLWFKWRKRRNAVLVYDSSKSTFTKTQDFENYLFFLSNRFKQKLVDVRVEHNKYIFVDHDDAKN